MKMSKKQVMTAMVVGMLCGLVGQAWAADPAIASGTGTDSVVAGLDNEAA